MMAVPKGFSIVRAAHEIVDAALTFRLQFLRIAREHASFPPIYPVDISLWTPKSAENPVYLRLAERVKSAPIQPTSGWRRSAFLSTGVLSMRVLAKTIRNS